MLEVFFLVESGDGIHTHSFRNRQQVLSIAEYVGAVSKFFAVSLVFQVE